MNRLVVLSLGSGNLQKGFEGVTARIWECGSDFSNINEIQIAGSLPAAPDIAEAYRHWQVTYSALYKQLNPRIKINDGGDMKNVSVIEFNDLCQGLADSINIWLASEQFRNIDQQLRTELHFSEEIQFIIETNDNLLRRLPWHLWNFFNDYPLAEAVLSVPEYKRVSRPQTKQRSAKVRILAIFGNSKGIDIQKEKAFLEQLSSKAETEFLVEPRPRELVEQLWKNWDILFFAGHSSSSGKGIIQLNETDSLTLDKLKYTLQEAISSGLKLAIFNSCDGLGLATQLADLHIPQVIVMREPVPDVVAQNFLSHFLEAFSSGQSLYASVRGTRKKLEALENEYPCASWLPVICQNPAEAPTNWQELCGLAPLPGDSLPGMGASPPGSASLSSRKKKLAKRRGLGAVLLASMAAAATVMGVRYMGMLQPLELQAFDQLVRLRPEEKPDPRILVIGITDNDITAQNPNLRRGSISDWALNRVLQVLEKGQPRAIGLDIYRDFPTPRKDLSSRFAREGLIGVCKVRDTSTGDAGIAPPPRIAAERQGFSDFVQDPDGILRRHLIAMTPDPASPCLASYAFSMQVAFRYLAAEGIVIKATPEGYLQIGTTVFKPLENHTSGYQKIDAWSHQILLNYRSPRSPQNIVSQVSLMQVLQGKLDPNLVKDRIVLIGVTANSAGDLWNTPYSYGQDFVREVPGVLVQAQMVSQILSTVLDQRPLLWAWPIWGEALWIWGWSMVGGLLAMQFRSPLILGLALGTALAILYGLCFILLLKGGWIPLVPSALTLVITGGIVVSYSAFQSSKSDSKNLV